MTWNTQHEAWREVMGHIMGLIQDQEWDGPLDGGEIGPVTSALMDAEDLLISENILDRDVEEMLTTARTDIVVNSLDGGRAWRMLMDISEVVTTRECDRLKLARWLAGP